MSKRIRRRAFLRGSALAAAGALAAACAKAPVPTPVPTAKPAATAVPATAVPATKPPATAAPTAVPATAAPTQAPAAAFKEAPMLADLVKAGKLPPVQDRLPKEPKLVNEMPSSLLKLEVGKYGGTARFGTTNPASDAETFVACNEPLINTPGILGEEFTPNIVKDYKVSADQQEFTFRLREGLKYSDGTPVTTADVRFAVEDVLLNKELTPTIPAWLCAANDPRAEPLKVDIVDDHTFKVSFAKPYGGFLAALGIQSWRGYQPLLKPSHYLKQFHKKYADPAKLEAAIKEEKLETWVQLFGRKNVEGIGPIFMKPAIGFPSLQPWLLKEEYQDHKIFERNPYYFKVDAAGQQLPYFDKLWSWVLASQDMFTMKQIAGEIDYTARFTVLSKLPLYKENEKNGYKTYLHRDHVTHSDFALNLTFEDPTWRLVVRDKRFRQALNMAIDRKEILDAVYYGYGEMPTIVPSDFNPTKAQQLLDELGMNKKGSDGFRLAPDGKPFVIPFEVQSQDPTFGPATEVVVENWKKIGINTSMKLIDSGLYSQRNSANQLQATTAFCHLPLWYMGDVRQDTWAPLWWRWRNSLGKEGEEPPAEVKALYQKISDIVVVPVQDGPKAYAELRKMIYDNVWFMPPLENVRQAMIMNAKYGNVPDNPASISIGINFSFEQIFLKG